MIRRVSRRKLKAIVEAERADLPIPSYQSQPIAALASYFRELRLFLAFMVGRRLQPMRVAVWRQATVLAPISLLQPPSSDFQGVVEIADSPAALSLVQAAHSPEMHTRYNAELAVSRFHRLLEDFPAVPDSQNTMALVSRILEWTDEARETVHSARWWASESKRLSRMGLFAATATFRQVLREKAWREMDLFESPATLVRQLKLEIPYGTNPSIQQVLERLRARNAVLFDSGETSFFASLSSGHLNSQNSGSNWWRENRDLNEAEVCALIGPGPTLENFNLSNQATAVARIGAPGVTYEPGSPETDDGLGTQILYCNTSTHAWIKLLPGHQTRHVSHLCFKQDGIPLVGRRERHFVGTRSLHLLGESYMMPSAILDLLKSGVRDLTVSGMTFYLGAQPYRSQTNHSVLTPGRDKRSFWIASMAQHDVIENHALMRFLWLHDAFKAESLTAEALNLESEEFGASLQRSLFART